MDYVEIFSENKDYNDNTESIDLVMQCMNEFASAFEAEDIAAMDKCLHFPHYIISANEMICWGDFRTAQTEVF